LNELNENKKKYQITLSLIKPVADVIVKIFDLSDDE